MAASTTLNAQQRIDRARKAGKIAQTPETWAKHLVRDWPDLNPAQQATIASMLRPVVGGGHG